MLQFSRFFFVCCSIILSSLKLRFVKVDKGLLQDIVTFYDHFKSYMFRTPNINMQIYTNLYYFLKVFVIA